MTAIFDELCEVAKELNKLKPVDTEAKGWDILHGDTRSCCPGDDAGLGYEQGLKDAMKIVKKRMKLHMTKPKKK